VDQKKLLDFAKFLKNEAGQKYVFMVYQREYIPQIEPSILNRFVAQYQDKPHILRGLYSMSETSRRDISFDVDLVKQAYADSSIAIHFLFMTPAIKHVQGVYFQERSEDIFGAFREINPIDEARYLISHLLSNAEEITFTFPRTDGNCELAPSPLIEDMLSYFPAYDTALPVALHPQYPPHTNIYAEEELFEAIGKSFEMNNPSKANAYIELIDQKDARLRVRRILKTDLARDQQAPFGAFDGLLSVGNPGCCPF